VIAAGTVAVGAASVACAAVDWAWVLLAIPCLAATIWAGVLARRRDIRLKTIHLWFDMTDDAGRRFKAFESALQAVGSCQQVWRVTTQKATDDWKRNAGSNTLVTRKAVALTRAQPAYFESNLRPYSLRVGGQTLYFFPDQILVYEGRRAGAVTYDSLEIDVDYTHFREENTVPSDARVVEHTWRYVNKKGGPDRRFTSNRQIPVCRYEELVLRSPTGLNVHLMLSRLGVAERLRQAEAQLVPLRREARDHATSAADADQAAFEKWIRSRRAAEKTQ
jgi:hypothetical protein